jgi:hypothetical protein
MPQAIIKFAKKVIAEGAVYEKADDEIYVSVDSTTLTLNM